MDYHWNWMFFFQETDDGLKYYDWILSGLGWTTVVSLASLAVALLLGSALGVMRTTPNRWLVGIGALAIPGIGPLMAAGPIVAALAGAGGGTSSGVGGNRPSASGTAAADWSSGGAAICASGTVAAPSAIGRASALSASRSGIVIWIS